jgi:hypothetical protein
MAHGAITRSKVSGGLPLVELAVCQFSASLFWSPINKNNTNHLYYADSRFILFKFGI